jgi:hypothetical protein
MKKENDEFEKFDKVMDGLLAVPYSELQAKLAEEKKDSSSILLPKVLKYKTRQRRLRK